MSSIISQLSTGSLSAHSDVDAVRSVLAGAKHIVVLVGDSASAGTTPVTSEPLLPLKSSQDITGDSTELGLTAAHLALAHFAVPHFRRTVTIEDSSFVIVTQNDQGLQRGAIEHVFHQFGLPSPFSPHADCTISQQDDPVLVEMCNFPAYVADAHTHARSLPIMMDGDDVLSPSARGPSASDPRTPELAAKPSADGDQPQLELCPGQYLVRALSNADVCVLVDNVIPSAMLIDRLQQVWGRGGTIVSVGNVDRHRFSNTAFHFQGPSEEIVPQVFCIGPNSRILEDGSVRTYYPGITVTANARSRHLVYANFMPLLDNTIPLHSKSYVDLRPPLKPRSAMTAGEVLALTDEDIVRLCKTSPSLTDTHLGRELRLPPVYLLASNVVVKVGSEPQLRESEAKAQALVRDQTTIPVPMVHRFFELAGTSYLVMEYVPGDTLHTCWNDLSNWQKLRIAFMLRNYVNQMRRLRTAQILQQVPGPVTDDPSRPLPCLTPALGEYPVGSFTSQAHLRDWMNGRFRVAEYLIGQHIDLPPFDDSAPLVFTHGDLCLRNIVLGADGRLWLIDFGSAGVYPPWFEAYGACDDAAGLPPPKLWAAARRIAVGVYDAQERFAQVCQHAFSYGLGIADPGEDWDTNSSD